MPARSDPCLVPEARVDAVRRFNRFYTRQIGLLQGEYLSSGFSLTAVRVLYELAHRVSPSAAEIRDELGLDAGYLSRILRRFDQQGVVTRFPSDSDRRRSELSLTKKGRK